MPTTHTTNMIEWTASAGRIHANGEVFNIKGANWFGTEGQHAMLYGLEKHGLDYYLKFLAANKFNSLRLLFNHEYVLSDPCSGRSPCSSSLARSHCAN